MVAERGPAAQTGLITTLLCVSLLKNNQTRPDIPDKKRACYRVVAHMLLIFSTNANLLILDRFQLYRVFPRYFICSSCWQTIFKEKVFRLVYSKKSRNRSCLWLKKKVSFGYQNKVFTKSTKLVTTQLDDDNNTNVLRKIFVMVEYIDQFNLDQKN